MEHTAQSLSPSRFKAGETTWLLLLFLALVFAASMISSAFLTFDNLQNVIRAISVIGVIALGMTLVMIVGEIDLSVGSVAAFSGMVGAQFVDGGTSTAVLLATLGAGLAAGAVNGIGVAWIGVPSLIMTLGMLAIARAVGNIVSRGQAAYPTKLDFYMWLSRGEVVGIPVPVIIFFLAVLIVLIVVKYFAFGRKIYAIGSNERAARLSGIKVRAIKTIVFALAGLFAAMANILQSSRLGQIDPAMGGGYELMAIAIAVLGGASLFGGRGSIEGTLIAALIIGVLNNLLNLLGFSIHIQQVVVAAIIVGIVFLHSLKVGRP